MVKAVIFSQKYLFYLHFPGGFLFPHPPDRKPRVYDVFSGYPAGY